MNNTTFLQQQLNILRQQAKALAEQIESMQITIDMDNTPLPPLKEAEESDNLVSAKPQQQEPNDVIKVPPDLIYRYSKINPCKYKPEQVRKFVETYNELAKEGNLPKTKIIHAIIAKHKLKCSFNTVHNAIFHHSHHPGYEDIPTPQLQTRPSNYTPKDTERIKVVKWLIQHGLNNSVIGRMLGISQSSVSAIRNNVTHTDIMLTDTDDKHLHEIYGNTLKEMGIHV